MVGTINNCFLINAPAGSGKTTMIQEMVRSEINQHPKDNILCITYTNRAAQELQQRITSSNVFIGTIHTFLHIFLKPYFGHSGILDLYFEVYGEQITERIENKEKKDTVNTSNERYIEKYGVLDYDTIKANIHTLSYNETQHSSLYYGGLSHDDLISFSKKVFDRFQKLRLRLSSKYQSLFIDEYQDTMSDVLKIFYTSVNGTNSKLFLFGDRMQQIYKNYDGSFEKQFEAFDTTLALRTNYRSTRQIVGILNRLYNNREFEQSAAESTTVEAPDYQPRVIITEEVKRKVEEIKRADNRTLVLYLFNRDRFSEIGAVHLYDAFNKMGKYHYGMAHSAQDVLTTKYQDNPDALMKLLFCVVKLKALYSKKQYGSMIQTLRENKSIFSFESWQIRTHAEKLSVFSKWQAVFSVLEDEAKNIQDLLHVLQDYGIIHEIYASAISEDADYEGAFSVSLSELKRLADELEDLSVSTQHGVKGESHDTVIFVAEDSSNNPVVKMYQFFEIQTKTDISLDSFVQFYYDYCGKLSKLKQNIGMRGSELKGEQFKAYEGKIKSGLQSVYEEYKSNPYFQLICKSNYNNFFSKPATAGRAKDCLQDNNVYGVLSAYRLFYVGCSRAKRNLTILLNKSKMVGDIEAQKRKFQDLGFVVEEQS